MYSAVLSTPLTSGEVSRSGSSVDNVLMVGIAKTFDEDQSVDGKFGKVILGGVAGSMAKNNKLRL
jgi:peptidoglycan hydrolase-like protein with peptidoglycan-binding domain